MDLSLYLYNMIYICKTPCFRFIDILFDNNVVKKVNKNLLKIISLNEQDF